MNTRSLTIAQVQEGLRARRFSAVELAQETLRCAEAQNPMIAGETAELRFEFHETAGGDNAADAAAADG